MNSKISKKTIPGILVFLMLSACHSNSQQKTTKASPLKVSQASIQTKPNKGGFALVELFTSEGCSSCPPADAVAGEIAKMAEENGEAVYVLPYHVDYWNYLGWKDRFSSEQFTKRQYWYAERFKSSQVYTPQMIINGQSEFTGSKKTMANEEIQTALENTVKSTLKIQLKEDFSYQIEAQNLPESWALHYALVEKELSSDVSAGENRGRKLYHYSVVRNLNTLKNPQKNGQLKVELPGKEGKFALVVFIQDQNTAEILAVNQLNL